MTPLVVVQLVSAVVFYNNHWDAISRKLAYGIAGDVRAVIDLLQDFPEPAQRSLIMGIANSRMELLISFHENGTLPKPLPDQKLTGRDLILYQAMTEKIQRPFTVNTHSERRYGIIRVQLNDSVLEVYFPKKRLYSFTTWLFLAWMGGTSVLLMGIATLFMRNQVRSVLRLAAAADRFGKGLETPDFKPEGASEVRQAALAFNLMRHRIVRQIQQRTSMLAGVSHDLRTPLTRMKLQLAMMDDVEGVEDLKLDIVEMEQMIEGYLAFARGEGSEKPESGDIAAMVAEVSTGFQRQGKAVMFADSQPIPLIFRPNVMRRALSNLIGNATRYGTNVTVSVATIGSQVEITIDDDGPGIPEPLREEVFKPFRRLEESRNQETGGVGLGLSIAQDVVRGHGGDIILGDAPMGGLRVVVRLPL
jgi:two-component system osmolarity sensor histidine kinase EnvZ